MKRNSSRRQKFLFSVWLSLLLLLLGASRSFGVQADTSPTWHAQTLAQAVGYMFVFALVGIGLAIAGYKLFDMCTPGDLNKEIVENKNVAAAIVAAAVILGVCLIIAAAMIG